MKETKIVCPKCGAEFRIAENEYRTFATVIGKDSGLGIIHPEVVGQTDIRADSNSTSSDNSNSNNNNNSKKSTKMNKAENQIAQLKAAGIDVTNYQALSTLGGDMLIRITDHGPEQVSDDDPVFEAIKVTINAGGQIPNKDLFRRWIAGLVLNLLTAKDYRGNELNPTEAIRRNGYDYIFKMVLNELNAQRLIDKDNDIVRYNERNLWFNKNVLIKIVEQDLENLRKVVEILPVRKCKGVGYKHIPGYRYNNGNVFVTDIEKKVYEHYRGFIHALENDRDSVPALLYWRWKRFMSMRVRLNCWKIKFPEAWMNAYKGAGAFFTLQNFIRFSGFFLEKENGERIYGSKAEEYLNSLAIQYRNEGWKLLGVLREALEYNHFDIDAKRKEWAEIKKQRMAAKKAQN